MFILFLLIGSFTLGIILQLTISNFSESKMLNSPRSDSLAEPWKKIRKHLHIIVVAYLLIHIGLIGGAEVAREGIGSLAVPGATSLALAMTMFAVTLLALSCMNIDDRDTRISLAVHFGSVSVGTFAAAQAFLKGRGIPYAPSTSAWLAVMEVPSILVGAVIIGGGLTAIKDIFSDRDILVLMSTLILGYILGHNLVHKLDFLIVTPFEGVLAYFLFDMGQHAGEHMSNLRGNGIKLISFGILMALFGGVIGGLAGTLVGLEVGNVIMISTLSASASYVAATAVMAKLVTPKAIATTLTVSLGITLPWNILFGIQLYTFMAQGLHDLQSNPYLIGLMLTWWLILVVGGLVAWPKLKMLRKVNWEGAGQGRLTELEG